MGKPSDTRYSDIPLESILESLGCPKGRGDMYPSPFRNERTPSLHVDPSRNVWYDHGIGIGGGPVKLVMMALGCDFASAGKYLSSFLDGSPSMAKPSPLKVSDAPRPPAKERRFKVLKVRPLGRLSLIKYVESRGISREVASRFCCEVVAGYREGSGKEAFLGFANSAGGYALNTPSGKKRSTVASPSFIDSHGKRSETPTTEGVAVFEGFFDFLSWMQEQPSDFPPQDAVILNSVVNIQKAGEYIMAHSCADCYLDRDDAGRQCLEKVRSMMQGREVRDCSSRYSGCKDYNEALVREMGSCADDDVKES